MGADDACDEAAQKMCSPRKLCCRGQREEDGSCDNDHDRLFGCVARRMSAGSFLSASEIRLQCSCRAMWRADLCAVHSAALKSVAHDSPPLLLFLLSLHLVPGPIFIAVVVIAAEHSG
eukprot:CAMPEP_0185252352 /NCGR_PEP_ID=MMETSP1359-20130426/1468_1 /TAXON_ID=552665 /ORGANISM="Bigelowiella longifila, Strain CCMP242" /LENGTH=117 /DNA_ID=CAMNT_0027834499 /DNA_START=564 /DNA_END=917 /DNA_ORIENTATION=+